MKIQAMFYAGYQWILGLYHFWIKNKCSANVTLRKRKGIDTSVEPDIRHDPRPMSLLLSFTLRPTSHSIWRYMHYNYVSSLILCIRRINCDKKTGQVCHEIVSGCKGLFECNFDCQRVYYDALIDGCCLFRAAGIIQRPFYVKENHGE